MILPKKIGAATLKYLRAIIKEKQTTAITWREKDFEGQR
jgi:hypothetical protein